MKALPSLLLLLAILLGFVLAPWPGLGIFGWPGAGMAQAAPGLCIGPICADEISRSSQFPWQLRLRLSDQRAHRERVVVDCRDGGISPLAGPVERGFAGAVVRRACRLAAGPGAEPAA
jgi:hypothetical protein